MSARDEQSLIERLRRLPPQRQAEVEDFVEFLAAKEARRAALDRLLAVVPALEAAGVEPMSEEEIQAEINAYRAERPAHRTAQGTTPSDTK
jgi:hypothetical protein